MEKIVAKNRKAWHDYHILETYEAGIVLLGTEVKSIREGKLNLTDAYCQFIDNELYLTDMNITRYSHAGYTDHDPRRQRKLLMNRRELDKLKKKREAAGLTLIPLSIYWKANHLKVEIGLAQGKKQYDKRADIAKRDAARTIEKQMKRSKQ